MAYTCSEIIEAIEETNGMITLAAEHLGCARKTIYNKAEKHPTVQRAIEREREKQLDVAELKLFQAIQNGEPWAIKFALSRQRKDKYAKRQEVTGADGEPLQRSESSLLAEALQEHLEGLDEDERDMRLEQLEDMEAQLDVGEDDAT